MATANDDAIATLNDLIETSRDGEQGFRTCAENTRSAELKAVFQKGADRCAQAIRELTDEVRRLGGESEKSGSAVGAAHRVWVDIKATLSGKDDAGILAECERGEDFALEEYRDALDEDLPDTARALVRRQLEGVQENHDRIRELRDRYKRQS